MISRQISWLTSTIPRPRHQWCWRYRQLKAPVWPSAQWRPVAQDLSLKAVRNIEKSSKLLCNHWNYYEITTMQILPAVWAVLTCFNPFPGFKTTRISPVHIRNAVLILSLHSGVRGNSLAQAWTKIHGHELVTSGYTGCPRIDPISWLHMLHQVLNFTSFASWVPFCWWFALKGILWPSYNSSRHGKMSVVPEIYRCVLWGQKLGPDSEVWTGWETRSWLGDQLTGNARLWFGRSAADRYTVGMSGLRIGPTEKPSLLDHEMALEPVKNAGPSSKVSLGAASVSHLLDVSAPFLHNLNNPCLFRRQTDQTSSCLPLLGPTGRYLQRPPHCAWPHLHPRHGENVQARQGHTETQTHRDIQAGRHRQAQIPITLENMVTCTLWHHLNRHGNWFSSYMEGCFDGFCQLLQS